MNAYDPTPRGRGLDQTTARRIAKALGGIAQGVTRGRYEWRVGGWAPHDLWVVVSLSGHVLHDGVDWRSPEDQAAFPLPVEVSEDSQEAGS